MSGPPETLVTSDEVLATAIRLRRVNFADGVSSNAVSRELMVTHESILDAFANLEALGLATLKRQGDSIFLSPSKSALVLAFKEGGLDYGPYLNRLHCGDSQIALSYFRREVLHKYFAEQEKYHFDDDVQGGSISTRDRYYARLCAEGREAEVISEIRYGKRKLSREGVAVTVILWDVAMLPYPEQLYWRSFQIEDPTFVEDDPSFSKFIRQDFGAEFVDHDDAIDHLYAALKEMNDQSTAGPLFRVIQNPHLVYPLRNNRRSYSEAHNELRKVIGPDSMNARVLKTLLKALRVSYNDNDGPWVLFKQLVSTVCDDKKQVLEPFERNPKHRSLSSHEVDPLREEDMDFAAVFEQDCLDVVQALCALAIALRAHVRGGNEM